MKLSIDGMETDVELPANFSIHAVQIQRIDENTTTYEVVAFGPSGANSLTVSAWCQKSPTTASPKAG